jgi:DNA replication protein DnaC
MDFEQAKSIISELSIAKRGKRLNFTGEIALRAAWEDIPIAQAIYEHPAGDSTTQGYVASRVGPDLWRFLSEELGIEIKKKNLRLVFEKLEKQGMFTLDKASPDEASKRQSLNKLDHNSTFTVSVMGNQPPNVPHFYGRNDDFLKLAASLTQNRSVALIGAAGIGKSALASMYVQHVTSKTQPEFQNIIWMSLHHDQAIAELIESHCANDELEAVLQENRSLFVIDCGSTKLEEDRDFQSIVHKFCVGRHQSSLLILSRNTVKTVQQLARIQRPATTIKLNGLADQDALQILRDQGIQEKSDCKKLIECFRGNPQLLLLAAERINRFCGGKLESFVLHKTSFASDYVRRVVQDYSIEELSSIEKCVLEILIQPDCQIPKWITFSELLADLSSRNGTALMSELIEVLENWEGMSLIESDKDSKTGEATFNLPPTIRKVLMRSTFNTPTSIAQSA